MQERDRCVHVHDAHGDGMQMPMEMPTALLSAAEEGAMLAVMRPHPS